MELRWSPTGSHGLIAGGDAEPTARRRVIWMLGRGVIEDNFEPTVGKDFLMNQNPNQNPGQQQGNQPGQQQQGGGQKPGQPQQQTPKSPNQGGQQGQNR